jgi:hypothetical protein
MEESDGVSSTQSVVGSDTVEDTENSTMFTQMEEVERDIRTLPFVTELSFVCAVKYEDKMFVFPWCAMLTVTNRNYDSCAKKKGSMGRPRPFSTCAQLLVNHSGRNTQKELFVTLVTEVSLISREPNLRFERISISTGFL